LILDEVNRRHITFPVDVMSAGINAAEGMPASRLAIEVAAEHGISLRFHRSRSLTAALIRKADLILTMERIHKEHILRTSPDLGNVHEVMRYGRETDSPPSSEGIADPMGGGREDYQRTFALLREEIVRIAGILFPLIRDKYSLV
jgi:protein-tyrosine-phosphatase